MYFNSSVIVFTKTYRIVEKLQYQDNTNEYCYIVVDKFQEFNPHLIKLKKENANDLKEKYF